jgi:multidrug efflux pump subunit AcrA (membrane-fusion protein)
MKQLVPIALLICCVLTVACSTAKDGSPQAGASQPTSVSTARATARNVSASFQESGSLIADESSDVAPAVAGRVAATPVNVGDSVKAGQVICELEHGDAQLKLDQARANLEQAKFALRQAQSRVGWIGEGSSDPESVPEVAAALASYESPNATRTSSRAATFRRAPGRSTGPRAKPRKRLPTPRASSMRSNAIRPGRATGRSGASRPRWRRPNPSWRRRRRLSPTPLFARRSRGS